MAEHDFGWRGLVKDDAFQASPRRGGPEGR